jgi:capsular polysaccharide biosynthesis protein/Mrp family chromosome partitioning ATPase
MDSIRRPDSFEVSDYTGVLRRRWWIVVGFTLLGLLGALAYVVVAPKTYAATAAVFVAPTGADQNNQVQNAKTTGAVNLDTEAQFVTSGTVAGIAARALHSPLTPYALSKEVSVTVPPNSEVLDISCKASTKAGAAACAEEFAKAYLQNRSASATAQLNAQQKNLAGQVAVLQKQITTLHSKIVALPAHSAARASAAATAASDRGQVHALNLRVSTLKTEAANVSGGVIITNALPPGNASSPKKSLILPGGLVIGLLLGLIVAFVWDRRDKRIQRPQDVERLFDLPVLLSLPTGRFGKQVSLASPRSESGRAFTELGQAVTATLGEGNHVLVVTGASPGPAASVVAANLAATLARTHPEVVLICADVSNSVGPALVGVEDGPGLVEVVAGGASVRDVIRGPSAMPGLWVITPGAETSLSGYVQHDTAKALISQLRRDARYVIIEAPAVEDGSDMFAFVEFADAALVVVEALRTHRDEVIESARRLQLLRAVVIGVAVLPAIGRRVKVRPPRQAQTQPRDWRENGRGDAAEHTGVPATLSTPAGGQDGRSRAVRSPDSQSQHADRIRGN